ncbi:MAG: hypothetical protein FJ149_05990 [Euryarchaeota archaeon]|nr:hypothetical protein [Euryarchaeota archaeon]
MSRIVRSSGAVLVLLAMVLSTTASPLLGGSPGEEGGGGDVPPAVPRSGGGEGGASPSAAGDLIYAILCPAVFKDYLAPLAQWKTRKGMNAEIFTLEQMLGAYVGDPAVPEFAQVHQYLRKLYQNNPDFKWALIVGDGDADAETFPVPYIFTNASHDPVMGDNTILDLVPSDVMYSGLERDWYRDYTSERWWESRDEDWTPEVYVGRWPVKSASEVTNNVNRVLNYEKSPPGGDWISSALFAGALYDYPNNVDPEPTNWSDGWYQWPHDNGRTVMLECADLFPPGMTKKMMFDYDQQYGGNYNPANDNLSAALFKAEFNKGYSLVTTASHAWISGNGINSYEGNGAEPPSAYSAGFESFFFWTDAASVTNGGRLPLMYSSACDAANFTTFFYPYPGENRDRSLEQLLKNPNGGAIGFISATNGDFWNPTEGNWWLEKNFWQQFFDGSYRPGEALYKSKVAYDAYLRSIGRNTDLPRIRQNKAIYCLLGDPEVPVWTAAPGTLSVDALPQLHTVPQEVSVTVRDASTSQPVKGAMVALTAGGTFARGFSDASGVARFTVDPADPGTVNVTVTAHNYLPFETTAGVLLSPADLTLRSDDISVKGAGPVIRVGEEVEVSAVIHNVGRMGASGVLVRFHQGDFRAGGTLIGSATIPSIGPRSNGTARITWTVQAGPDEIFVVADPDGTVPEFREDNNVASARMVASGLDLSISDQDIAFEPVAIIDGQPVAAAGSTLTLTATVHNTGTETVATCYVRFFDGDPAGTGVPIGGDLRLANLPSGGAANASVAWNGTTPGTHEIFVWVDPLGFLAEYDEGNNLARRTLGTSSPPLFVMDIGEQSTDEDRPRNAFMDLTLYVTDPDNDVASLVFRIASQTAPEADVTVTAGGLLSVRPEPDWNGRSVVTVGVSDGVSEVFSDFNMTVRPVNDAPLIEPIPDTQLEVGRTYHISVNASDIDEGDTLAYSAGTTLFSIDRATGRIAYTPAAAHVGKHAVTMTVTDSGGLTASTVWRFNVTRSNSAPVLLVPADLVLNAREGRPFHFKFNASDAEGDALIFSDDSPFFDIDPATGEVSFTPPKGSSGVHFFNITVRDAPGLSQTRMFTLNVTAPVIIDGKVSGTGWQLPLLLVLALAGAAAAGAAAVLRRRSGRMSESDERARYEELYGAGTYDSASKSRSSSLAEFRQKQKVETAAAPSEDFSAERREHEAAGRKCPKCGSLKIQTFPDGGAICNNCGKMFQI